MYTPERVRKHSREETHLRNKKLSCYAAVTALSVGLVWLLTISTPVTSKPVVQVEEESVKVCATHTITPTVISKEAVNVVAKDPKAYMQLWGSCRVTAYCPCEKCCGKWARNRPVDENEEVIVTGASGKRLSNLEACASSLPFGTKLYIPELDLYVTVEDRAAKRIDKKYNGMYVDLYIDDHAKCFEYLRVHNDYMEVYIIE